jgi:hypothetical protein
MSADRGARHAGGDAQGVTVESSGTMNVIVGVLATALLGLIGFIGTENKQEHARLDRAARAAEKRLDAVEKDQAMMRVYLKIQWVEPAPRTW